MGLAHLQTMPPANSPSAVQEPLTDGQLHVWTVGLSDHAPSARDWGLLSREEDAKARRFHFQKHREQYVLAHAALRQILAAYAEVLPQHLQFVAGAAGKPAIAVGQNGRNIEFNLSHSGDYAIVAVTRGRAVGVDIEQWNDRVEFLDLATHYFSPQEYTALLKLRDAPADLMQGFFQAWSRKEAYLKATGAGITNGLHHFDVSLAPDEDAALLIDRTDASATTRWVMMALPTADGYSAAVCVGAPVVGIRYWTFG